jgi:phage baseplate assembly protein gpV
MFYVRGGTVTALIASTVIRVLSIEFTVDAPHTHTLLLVLMSYCGGAALITSTVKLLTYRADNMYGGRTTLMTN